MKLTNLDGTGFLCGDWACVYSETGNPAYSPTNTFSYNRHDDEFEQVMAYYWITEAQKYIQSLGFGSVLRPVNMQSQRVRLNQLGYDNSFATTTPKTELRFGKGGVDDAEDAEVILHEYGHAIHFSQNFDFGGDGGAISEGFGDYWAVTVSDHISPTPDEACVADWDSVSYTSRPAALPAARRHGPPLPGGSERRGASRRPDLVARAVGHPQGARPDDGRHGHPPGLVRLPRHDDDRPREPDRAGRAGPLRLRRRDKGQEGVPGPRHPLTRSASGSTSSRSSGRSSAASRSRGRRAQTVDIPEEELNEALRRALVVRAVGGSPQREVTLDEDAVVRLAGELDSAERRAALRRSVDARACRRSAGRGRGQAADALLADDDFAWRCFATGLLADEVS